MTTWIQAHAVLLVAILTAIIICTPIVGNALIRAFHALSKAKGDGWDRAANWLIAKAPLVIGAAVFLRDAIVHPEQLFKIQNAAADMTAVATAKNPDDKDVAIVSARLDAAVAVPVTAKPSPAALLVLPILVMALLGLLVAGCSGPLADVVHVVQVEGRIVVAAEPCLVSAYKAEQQACIDDHPETAETCVAAVRARWRPVIDALVEEHELRCKLEPAKCQTGGK